jgi:hypothetical protein
MLTVYQMDELRKEYRGYDQLIKLKHTSLKDADLEISRQHTKTRIKNSILFLNVLKLYSGTKFHQYLYGTKDIILEDENFSKNIPTLWSAYTRCENSNTQEWRYLRKTVNNINKENYKASLLAIQGITYAKGEYLKKVIYETLKNKNLMNQGNTEQALNVCGDIQNETIACVALKSTTHVEYIKKGINIAIAEAMKKVYQEGILTNTEISEMLSNCVSPEYFLYLSVADKERVPKLHKLIKKYQSQLNPEIFGVLAGLPNSAFKEVYPKLVSVLIINKIEKTYNEEEQYEVIDNYERSNTDTLEKAINKTLIKKF